MANTQVFSYKELMTKLIVAQEDINNLNHALESAEDEKLALTSRLNECYDTITAIYEIAKNVKQNAQNASKEQLIAAIDVIVELSK